MINNRYSKVRPTISINPYIHAQKNPLPLCLQYNKTCSCCLTLIMHINNGCTRGRAGTSLRIMDCYSSITTCLTEPRPACWGREAVEEESCGSPSPFSSLIQKGMRLYHNRLPLSFSCVLISMIFFFFFCLFASSFSFPPILRPLFLLSFFFF